MAPLHAQRALVMHTEDRKKQDNIQNFEHTHPLRTLERLHKRLSSTGLAQQTDLGAQVEVVGTAS